MWFCGALLLFISAGALGKAARLAIVVDDMGYNVDRAERLLQIPAPMTFAVLPFAPKAREVAILAHAYGKEVILHQPMEPHPGPTVRHEHGTLTHDMSPELLSHTLRRSIRAVPNLAGVSNHTGSLLTAHSPAMQQVMSVIKEENLYFLDSRTTAQTVAMDAAVRNDVPAVRRDVFLDHTVTYQAIDASFRKALAVARRRGQAVLIAHPHAASIRYLEAAVLRIPADVELVTAGDLARKVYRAAPVPQQIATFPHK